MLRVLLLPGLMGTGNLKRDALIQAGFDVNAVTFDDSGAADWQDRFHAPLRNIFRILSMLKQARRLYCRWVAQAQAEYDSFQPDLVVGASRGGSVAMTIRVADNVPMVLLAPAFKWFAWIGGRTMTAHPNVTVIHSRQDDTIPFADSVELCRKCPQVKLMEAGSEHSLNTSDALTVLVQVIRDLITPGK